MQCAFVISFSKVHAVHFQVVARTLDGPDWFVGLGFAAPQTVHRRALLGFM